MNRYDTSGVLPINAIPAAQLQQERDSEDAACAENRVAWYTPVTRRFAGLAACMHCGATVPVSYTGTALDISAICATCGKQTWIDLRKVEQK